MSECGYSKWDGTPRPSQATCIKDALLLFNNKKNPMITSIPGAGKTAIGSLISKEWSSDFVLVISPVSGFHKWHETLSTLFKSDNYDVITYESLRSSKTLYVTKLEDGFTTSAHWNAIISNKSRVVVILDEFHRLQNKSLQTRAACVLTRSIIFSENENRLIYISYTPCDNKSDYINIAYAMGYIDCVLNTDATFSQLKTYIKRAIELDSSINQKEIEYYEKMAKFGSMSGKSSQSVRLKLITEIFEDVIVPAIAVSSIPEYAENIELTPLCSNLLCEVDKNTAVEIENIMGAVIKVLGGGKITKIIKKSRQTITTISEQVEMIKIPIVYKLTKNFLEQNNKNKVVIMVLHLETLDKLSEMLQEYGVANLQGSMSKKDRLEAVEKFQQHNCDCRVFVSSIRAGSESIDLHDTSEGGNFKRLILIPPCYYTKSVVQASRRVYRDGLTSRPEIKILYTSYEGKSLEKRYYDSIETKSKTIVACQGHSNNILPCDFPTTSISL